MSTLEAKILSCHGKLKARSAAAVLGIKVNQVYMLWRKHNKWSENARYGRRGC